MAMRKNAGFRHFFRKSIVCSWHWELKSYNLWRLIIKIVCILIQSLPVGPIKTILNMFEYYRTSSHVKRRNNHLKTVQKLCTNHKII